MRSIEAGSGRRPDYLAASCEVTFRQGRTAFEVCPTEIAVPVWCAHMGTVTFLWWPVRCADVDRPDELRIDLDPSRGRPSPTRSASPRSPGLLEELGITGYAKTSGN